MRARERHSHRGQAGAPSRRRPLGGAWLFVATLLLAPTHARGQVEIRDDDAVRVLAHVVGDMVVDAEGQIIDLGQVAQGASFSVASDGSGDGEVATFLLKAPAQADVALTVIYADLTRAGTTDVVDIDAPDGIAVCFRRQAGSGPCDAEVENPEGGGIHRRDMGRGAGIAYVGYSVTVDPDTEPGEYANEEAITLEAEALLGRQPSF